MILWTLGLAAAVLAVVAIRDLLQRDNAVRHNFPVLGHLRGLLAELGPPLRQYFFINDRDERPYDRVTRTWVYQSAAGRANAIGFGTQADLHAPGRVSFLPSLYPTLAHQAGAPPQPPVIGPRRGRPYQPQRFVNISGMSFGALSAAAVSALSRGAKLAGCYMSTGEGGLSPYHIDGGGDIVFQIGPAKFGCRTPDGQFDDEAARAIFARPQVKMIEIKLGQGAKPGQGGLLPKEKITPEIAAIRGIALGQDCQSPNGFAECRDASSLLDFLARVRRLTDKPVGLKLVGGQPTDLDLLCQEMLYRGEWPDFIVVDGAEGGTGAGPLALADLVGAPLREGLIAVDTALRRAGLRDEIRVIASGRIATAGDAAVHLALGADLIHVARGFLLSLGCIQALRCHTNTCPAGITTQNRWLQAGLDPANKAVKVANYSRALERELLSVAYACGVTHPNHLRRHHLAMNLGPGVQKRVDQVYPYPEAVDEPEDALVPVFTGGGLVG